MTQTFKILAAVDLSDYSDTTVRYSLAIAKKMSADLILVNVINQRDLDIVRRAMVGYDSFSFDDYLEEQIKDRRMRMTALLENAGRENIRCRFIVKDGIPYQKILETVTTEGADLLVVSTKGRSNLADVMVGSTASKLFRQSPIPMVSIPATYIHPSWLL
ncbi:universal stress protein [Desulfosarcina sp. OttesenSCG-928-A07]|nr:universal stress protein [Desulfosarcina sp. OttesenSCG-928-G17]MDL2329120.1 universal stress protein [Desulfosarcina sp. OttesenSCG-928-A07]